MNAKLKELGKESNEERHSNDVMMPEQLFAPFTKACPYQISVGAYDNCFNN